MCGLFVNAYVSRHLEDKDGGNCPVDSRFLLIYGLTLHLNTPSCFWSILHTYPLLHTQNEHISTIEASRIFSGHYRQANGVSRNVCILNNYLTMSLEIITE